MRKNRIELRVSDFLYAVLKRWRQVLALTIAGIIFGLVLNGIAFMQGANKQYQVKCSFAIAAQSSIGTFTGNSAYLNPNDFYLAQDMTDAVEYVITSRRVLEEALDRAGFHTLDIEEIIRNLRLQRHNETQIMEMTLNWNDSADGIKIVNAILETAGKVMPETLKIGAVAVINEPEVNYHAVGGVFINIWGIMGILGFLAGIALTVLDLLMRPTLINLSDVENVFELENIGTIPRDDAYFRKKKNLLIQSEVVSRDVEQNFSSSANILKNLLGTKEEHQCFYVTSAGEGEGKTVVAANIAIQLSDMEKNVLLVDLNTRNPGLSSLFLDTVDYSQSLNALYRGEASKEEVILSLTGYLDFIPTVLERNALPLDSTLLDFLEEIRESYDYVIIDTPAVGKDSGVLRLNQVVNMVLFVVRYDMLSLYSIQDAVEKLDKSGTRILGCIVNGTQSIGKNDFFEKKPSNEKKGEGYKTKFFNRKNAEIEKKSKEDVQFQSLLKRSEESDNKQIKTKDESQEHRLSSKGTRFNVLEEFEEENTGVIQENLSDEETIEALVKMGINGSWKNSDE